MGIAWVLLLAACGSGGGDGSSASGGGAAANTATPASAAPAATATPGSAAAGAGTTTTTTTTTTAATPATTTTTPAAAGTTTGTAQPGATTAASGPTAFATELLQRVNAIRASAHDCGTTRYAAAAPLAWDTQAEDAARTQAVYLQGNELFTHTGANGSTVGDRLTAAGYPWSTVGENIAAGYPNAAAVVAGWLASPGHCANMSNPAFADLGVVLQPGNGSNRFDTYWVMVLAHRR